MFVEFSRVHTPSQLSRLKSLIASSKTKIAKLKLLKAPTYMNFVRAYMDILDEIDVFFKPLSIVNAAKTTPAIQEAYTISLEELTKFYNEQKQDAQIYAIFKTILQNEQGLNQEQIKTLKDEIKGFELSGIHLGKKAKKKIAQINIELSSLGNKFSQNVLKATQDFSMEVSQKDLGAMPKSDQALFKKGNSYVFSLQAHSFISFMRYSPNEKLRKKIHKAYSTKAPKNEQLIEKILKLRHKKARILGFENFAQYALQTRMAKDTKEVLDLLKDLFQKSKKIAKDELKAIEKQANKPLKSYDIAFYSKILEEKVHKIKDEDYMPYFEVGACVDGALGAITKLFGIRFKKVKAKVWDDDVLAYNLYSGRSVIGRLYLDLHARDNKRGGAWMDGIQSRKKTAKDKLVLPSAYISCNFAPKKPPHACLLKHDDIHTLFHELGHAIHHLFTQVDELSISGINGVEWDAVELPSQFLENLAYEKDVLQSFAKHHKTQDILPDEMIDRLINAKNFLSALAMLRQVEFGYFDMQIHQRAYTKKEVQKILDKIRKSTSLVKPQKYNKFQNSFSHIFAGGYCAGYYSYKWAEVLSANALKVFKQSNFSRRTANRFNKAILSAGARLEMQEAYKIFDKKPISVDALLELSGIVNES